jgi:hypothetical protein
VIEIRPAHRPRSWPLLAAAAASLTFAAPAFADHRPNQRPGIREARAAARAFVVDHKSYRSIKSSHPLVTRSCWRSRRAVRCSLYRWAPTPCALAGGDGPCAQVLTRRTWLVTVSRRNGRTIARVTRIADTSTSPSQASQSASARSSS